MKAVFGVTEQNPGTYAVTVSQEENDWYEIFGTDIYIKTSGCISLALGEKAFLHLIGSEYGSLQFNDGNQCMVDGVYTKIRF